MEKPECGIGGIAVLVTNFDATRETVRVVFESDICTNKLGRTLYMMITGGAFCEGEGEGEGEGDGEGEGEGERLARATA